MYGGIIYGDNSLTLTFDGITAQSSSSEQGTFFYIAVPSTSTNAQTLTFLNTVVLSSLSASDSGGAFYLNSALLTLSMANKVQLSNVVAMKSGGVFYVADASSITLSNPESTFSSISSTTSGEFIYASPKSSLSISISNTFVQCSTATYSRLSSSALSTTAD